MMKTAQVPLRADRWTPFAYVVRVDGVDLTGADLHAQIRLAPDSAGLVVDLPLVGAPTAQGVRLMRVDTSGAVPASYVRLQIPGGSLGGTVPSGAEQGDIVQLAWDLLVTLPGRTRAKWLGGPFSILPGATQLPAAPLAADPPPGTADAVVAVDGEALTVAIAGTDVLGPLFDATTAARDAASASAVGAAASARSSSLAAAASAALTRVTDTYADGVAQYGALPFAIFSGGGVAFYTQANGPAPIAAMPDLLALSGPRGTDLVHFGQMGTSATLERSLAYYLVDPDSAVDQSDALIAAFAQAKADGVTRLVGNGRATYRLSKPLTIDSLVFDGRGCTFQRDDPAGSRIRLIGPNAGMTDTTIYCPTAIHGDPLSVGRGRGDDSSIYIALMLDGVVGGYLDRVTVRGGAGAGILLLGCLHVRVGIIGVFDTEADGFHVTYTSNYIVVEHVDAANNGDDQIAMVGYRNEYWVQNITIKSALLRGGAARAIAVCGARTVKLGKMQVEGSAAAALYVASDENAAQPALNTHGAYDVYVEHLEAVNCVTTLDGYSPITIAGKAGSTNVNGEDVTNGVVGVVIRDFLIRGVGAHANSGLAALEFADLIEAKGKMYDLRGAQQPQVARLGCGSITLEVEAERYGGDGITWTGTETGLHRIRRTKLSDGNKDGTNWTFKSFLGWVSATAAATYDVEDMQLLSGGTAGVASLGGATPTPGTLRMVNTRLDRRQVRHVDPVAEQWTFDGSTFTIALTDLDEPAPFRQTIPAGGALRVSFSPPFRLVLELIAVSATDQSQSVRLIESLAFVFGAPASGVAGTDYVQISADGGGQYVVRSRTGPGEGIAGSAGLIPIALAFDGTNVWLTITPPGPLDVRLALEVTRKTQ